jgi:hypothetical protein
MAGMESLKKVMGPYPDCCHDWDGAGGQTQMTPFGKALQDVYLLVDPNKSVPVEDAWFKDSTVAVKLDALRKFTSLSEQDFERQMREFRHVVNRRADIIAEVVKAKGEEWFIANLIEKHQDMWGAKRQYAFGRQVTQCLKEYNWTTSVLGPVFGMLLFPTGGIVGPGNNSMYEGTMKAPLVIHACVHDAFGYLLNYHKIGPGFNYLNTTFTAYKTDNPLCCQAAGIVAAATLVMKAACSCDAGSNVESVDAA